MDIETIYNKSITGEVELADFESCANDLRVNIKEVFNKVSLLFATRFSQDSVSYEDADSAMNEIWPLMLDYVMVNNLELIEPCYSVYCSFDEGEYDHGDDSDPVEMFTKPAIEKILKNA